MFNYLDLTTQNYNLINTMLKALDIITHLMEITSEVMLSQSLNTSHPSPFNSSNLWKVIGKSTFYYLYPKCGPESDQIGSKPQILPSHKILQKYSFHMRRKLLSSIKPMETTIHRNNSFHTVFGYCFSQVKRIHRSDCLHTRRNHSKYQTLCLEIFLLHYTSILM